MPKEQSDFSKKEDRLRATKERALSTGELVGAGAEFVEEEETKGKQVLKLREHQIEGIKSDFKRAERNEKDIQEALSYGLSDQVGGKVRRGEISYSGQDGEIGFPFMMPQAEAIEFIEKIPNIRTVAVSRIDIFTEQVLGKLLQKSPNVRIWFDDDRVNHEGKFEFLKRLHSAETKFGAKANIGGLRIAYKEAFKEKSDRLGAIRKFFTGK